jgi:hypothetical protein
MRRRALLSALALLLLALLVMLFLGIRHRAPPPPERVRVDESPAPASPPLPAPLLAPRSEVATVAGAPTVPDPPPIIDDIIVEKPEVCAGEENLITVKAHTENGTFTM